jgi:formylglycine-generating enzyme required for sulfatase activity
MGIRRARGHAHCLPFYSGDITPQTTPGECYAEPNLPDIAWYCQNSGKLPHEVGQKLPNAWGIHDVLGNVLEWVFDGANDASLNGAPPWTNPSGTILDPYPKREKVQKGGAFEISADGARAADKFWGAIIAQGNQHLPDTGFRLVRTVD